MKVLVKSTNDDDAVSEPRAESVDEVLVPNVRRDRLVDPCRDDIEDPLRPRRPRPARGLRDECDRVRLEVETVFPAGLVDLRGVREEPAVVEDLVGVPDERAPVAEVHQLPLKVGDELLHLGDPLLPMPADAIQLPLRREPEGLLDEDELLRPPALALDELVHLAARGVHEGRGGALDEISPPGQGRGPPGEAGAPPEPQDRPQEGVALHVLGTLARVHERREPPPRPRYALGRPA